VEVEVVHIALAVKWRGAELGWKADAGRNWKNKGAGCTVRTLLEGHEQE
jgi:hypothetical protein